MGSSLQATIDAAWERRTELSPQTAPAEVVDAVASAIAELDAGRLRVAEKADGKWITHQWLKKAVLLSFRLAENVAIGLHAQMRAGFFDAVLSTPRHRREERSIRDRSMAVLQFAGLAGLAHARAGALAYGHRRLLEIARAIVARPTLLLLDEPAAGLNVTEAAHVSELIARIRDDGTTVILVEHHMDVVMRVCDEITVLNYGRRLAHGTPAQIQEDPGVIEAYLGRSGENESAQA